MNTATIASTGLEKVWILEMNSTPLKVDKKEVDKKKIYKYRGLCAEFDGELNENNRAYDKGNYDDKANALQDKIKSRALCGELDHNEDFLVSMKNASHVITELKKNDNNYEIEIELIPGTTQGDNAIALAEAGVPLFISSRASGYIDRNGNVTLEKIYTYDLVSEPGFKNAELTPVNESLQPQRRFKNSEVRIFRFTDPKDKHKGNTDSKVQEINTQNKESMNYASKAEVNALKKQIEKLTQQLGPRRINESLQVPTKLKFNGIPVEMLNKIPQKNDVITIDSADFTVKQVQNIDESADGSPEFKLRGTYAYTLGLEGKDGLAKVGYITKTGEFHVSDEGISNIASIKENSMPPQFRKLMMAIESKMNEIVDSMNAHKVEQKVVTEYLDGIGKILEHTINQHDKAVKFMNVLADHSDTSTHVINGLLEGSDQVTEQVNLITESLEATQQFVNEHAAYTDVQTNLLNTIIAHSEKATKHLNMLHKHSDQLTSQVNVHENKLIAKRTAPAAAGTPVALNESKTPGAGTKPAAKAATILEQTKTILNKVNSNKAGESRSILESKFPFLTNLSDEEVTEFRNLSDAKKSLVVGKVGLKARKANVLETIRYVAKQVNGLEFLEMMTVEKKGEWNRLPLARKQNIIALFQSKNLRTRTAIEDFWDTINLKQSNSNGLIRRPIQESIEKQTLQLEKSAMGYSEDDMTSALGL